MTIEQFAERHRLRIRRDAQDGTDVIPGRLGHLYEYGATELGFLFMPQGKPRPRKWTSMKRTALAAGMVLRQGGAAEGAFSLHLGSEFEKFGFYPGSVKTG